MLNSLPSSNCGNGARSSPCQLLFNLEFKTLIGPSPDGSVACLKASLNRKFPALSLMLKPNLDDDLEYIAEKLTLSPTCRPFSGAFFCPAEFLNLKTYFVSNC